MYFVLFCTVLYIFCPCVGLTLLLVYILWAIALIELNSFSHQCWVPFALTWYQRLNRSRVPPWSLLCSLIILQSPKPSSVIQRLSSTSRRRNNYKSLSASATFRSTAHLGADLVPPGAVSIHPWVFGQSSHGGFMNSSRVLILSSGQSFPTRQWLPELVPADSLFKPKHLGTETYWVCGSPDSPPTGSESNPVP